jgi:hypothetical protein
MILLAACGTAGSARGSHHPNDGALGGVVRDEDSGEPLALAELHLSNGASAKSLRDGIYLIDHVKPGRYSLVATYAGQTVTVNNIDVKVGDPMFVDVMIPLGRPEPVTIDFSTKLDAITRYTPKNGVARLEGAVSEQSTRARVAGAVVTAVGGPRADTLQTVTDDAGRYHFDAIEPGTYAISAYYNIGGRGQIEVRRSDIAVERGEGVIVPITLELTKQ